MSNGGADSPFLARSAASDARAEDAVALRVGDDERVRAKQVKAGRLPPGAGNRGGALRAGLDGDADAAGRRQRTSKSAMDLHPLRTCLIVGMPWAAYSIFSASPRRRTLHELPPSSLVLTTCCSV
jgi:hypothetical protein